MSAKIPANMEIKDLLKATGYDCPEDLQNKTFNEATSDSGGGGSANLTTKEISAPMLRNSVENRQAITPPDGVDGFSEITFPNHLLTEKEITVNGTTEFGTNSAPYFPKKVTVNIPSNYTIEEKEFSKSSEPFILDCSDKTFIYFMDNSSPAKGLIGFVGRGDMRNDISVTITSGGQTAGTITWTASTKTLTYTPNTSFPMGSIHFDLVTI